MGDPQAPPAPVDLKALPLHSLGGVGQEGKVAAGSKTWGSQQPFLSSGLPVCKMGVRAPELQLRAPEPSTGQVEIADSRVQKLVGSPGADMDTWLTRQHRSLRNHPDPVLRAGGCPGLLPLLISSPSWPRPLTCHPVLISLAAPLPPGFLALVSWPGHIPPLL